MTVGRAPGPRDVPTTAAAEGGLIMRRHKYPIKPDLTGGPFVSQIPEAWSGSQRPEKPMPPRGPSGMSKPPGTIRETCSCSATIEVPGHEIGREILSDWRHMHRHDPRAISESTSKPEPDIAPSTGELRQETARFGFSPPMIEAKS